MQGAGGVDLERTRATAWRRFRRGLADRIADLEIGDSVLVEVEGQVDDEDSGCPPYVQIIRGDELICRAEVSSNHCLHARYHIDKASRARLRELGWSKPSSKGGELSYWFDFEPSHADEVAVMAVRALQEVFRVVHPAFLVSGIEVQADPALPTVSEQQPVDEPLAVVPARQEDLERLVDEALVPVFGNVPTRDGDGDIPVVNGSAVVFVRVLEDMPVIWLFAELVRDVTDLERARFEVAVLNRDRDFAKFVLVDNRIRADVHLPAWPFVPLHLRHTLAMLCQLADAVDDDLAVRVGGKRFLEPCEGAKAADPESSPGDEVGGDLHPAMLTLLQLAARNRGSLKPRVAARVCDYDPQLITDLIRWNEQQELEWRQARDAALAAGDPDDEAGTCELERVDAQRTVKVLRKALRLVVDGQRSAPS